jgi:hypothetical protein
MPEPSSSVALSIVEGVLPTLVEAPEDDAVLDANIAALEQALSVVPPNAPNIPGAMKELLRLARLQKNGKHKTYGSTLKKMANGLIGGIKAQRDIAAITRGEKVMRRELPKVYWRLSAAVEGMACSAEPIQRRLRGAVEQILIFQERDFPAGEQCDLFKNIIASSTHVQPVSDEGSLEATTSRMTADEASAVARDLVKLLGLIVHS